MIPLLVIVLIVLVLLVGTLALYNNLVRGRLRVREGWSGVQVQLRRRADLVPNLVETVKGYAAHERGVFESVTKARAQLQSAATPRGSRPGQQRPDPGTALALCRRRGLPRP